MKMRFQFVSCGAALIALIAPMASSQTPTPSSSGIEGVVMVSPSRPGPIRVDTPSSAPAPNVQFVVKKEDMRVASFTTDAEGRFRVSLPPGHYTIVKEPASKIGHWQFEAEVKAGEITKVQWVGDSGMR